MADLISLAQDIGFSHAARLNAKTLVVRGEVRDMCASGRCQRYGHSWSCPPACGSLEHISKLLSSYTGGVLVQATTVMDGDFDAEAIERAQKKHKEDFATLARQARLLHPDCLPLTAGTCTLCNRCTYPDRPCRYPAKRLSSMEAFGLLVRDVCRDAGLPYYYGPGTLTFSSCILTREDEKA